MKKNNAPKDPDLMTPQEMVDWLLRKGSAIAPSDREVHAAKMILQLEEMVNVSSDP